MIAITVQDQAIQAYLAQLARRMGNLQPVMRSIATEMETRVSARFETQSDPNGQPWKAWKPATLAAYPKSGHNRLLDRYGDMLNSLNSMATADTARIGFGAVGSVAGDVYAVYHEFGTKHMERRGLLFGDPEAGTLGAGDAQAMDTLLSGWLNSIVD
jgi:phage virion morphogenesis protein